MDNCKEHTPDEIYLNSFHFNKSVSALRKYYDILGTSMWVELSKLKHEERLEVYESLLEPEVLNNEHSMEYLQKTINNTLNILVN